MITAEETRHARLLQLIDELGGERRGMTELARRLGHASTSTLSQYKTRQPDSKTGKPKGIGAAAARRIEHACDKPHGWMDVADTVPQLWHSNSLQVRAQSTANTTPGPAIERRVPLISWIQAGMWNETVDVCEPGYAEAWIPVLRQGGEALFALRVEGDSMTALHGAERRSYPAGCLVIIDPAARQPSNGDRIIARVVGTGAVTFKQFQESETGEPWLQPINPQHPSIHAPFEVLGTVVAKYDPE